MNVPQLYEPSILRDPKLAIKSSFPDLKSGLGWLVLLNIVANEASHIEPHRVTKHATDQIEFRPEIADEIERYFVQSGLDETQIAIVRERAQNSPLIKKQLEPMVAAFEIFMPLARIEFIDTSKSASAEREGGVRFEKTFHFTANLRELRDVIQEFGIDGAKLLFSWIANSQTREPEVERLEARIRKFVLRIAADTIYRIETEDGGIQHFNTLGLYQAVLASTDSTAYIHSTKEVKGPLRILKVAISSDLLPWLTLRNDRVGLANSSDRAEVANYIDLIEEVIDLNYVSRPEKAVRSSARTLPAQNAKRGENLIVYGVPGCGKSHYIATEVLRNSTNVTRTVFHPDYMYSNFVGQILPVVKEGDVSYEFTPGPFTTALKAAFANPMEHHYLVIEEINRGNAPAIFGDVFHLLDRSNDGSSEYSVSNSEVASFLDEYLPNQDESIFIPRNLSLLATMNTSDQNVFTLDTAFQRRWRMHMIKNDISMVSYAETALLDTSVTWRSFMQAINQEILAGDTTVTSSEDKRLGRFFLSERDLSGPPEAFAEKAIKYLWDDAFKFDRDRIFKNPGESLEQVVDDFVKARSDHRWEVVFTPTVTNRLVSIERTSMDGRPIDASTESEV